MITKELEAEAEANGKSASKAAKIVGSSRIRNAAHEQEVIAFHEAAHATILHFYGHMVAAVEIGGGTGRCTLPKEFQVEMDDAASRALTEREVRYQLVMGLCAGRHAMRRWHDSEEDRDQGWENSKDRKRAMSHCLKLSDGDEVEAGLLLAWLSHRAEKLVEQQWSNVHRLAFELLEHNALSGKQVAKIIGNSQ